MSKTLRGKFLEYIIDWQDKLSDDEWYFCNFREDITSELLPYQAYDLIPEAVDLIISQQDQFLCSECMQLLLSLVRTTETTEIHPYLQLNWDDFLNHVVSFGEYHIRQVQELKTWYRKYD